MCIKGEESANENVVDVEAQPEVATPTATKNAVGFHLRWSRISKSVLVKEVNAGLLRSSIASRSNKASAAGPVTKIIMDEVSGSALPGEVLAMMGPSGSGKTTLLNIISGRAGYDSGAISINGELLTTSSRKKLMSKIAYVKQQDIFFEHLTVRDQLTYTALLRLSSSMPKEKKYEEVDKVISLLRLNKVADSPIYLCSGGEKKRVNIGTELLTDPQVLLLDEPTSGLDSTSAVALIELLQKLCRSENKTVITSIHQPSSAVFRSFDKLLMLAEGNVVYFGTPAGSLTYLSDLNLKTPEGYNAADHWMDLLVQDTLIEEDEENDNIGTTERSRGSTNSTDPRRRRKSSVADQNKPRGLLMDAWDGDAVADEISEENKSVTESQEESRLMDDVKKYNTSWLTQYLVLTHRSLKNSRSAIFTVINFVKSVALGIVAGLLWFQVEITERTVRDVSSFFFFTMTYWVFDSMFNAVMAFPSERNVILKERASSSYRLSAYFMAKTTSEAPMRLILPFLYVMISFWMSGVNNKFSVFIGTTGCTLLSVMSGEAIGLLMGAAIYDMQKALTTMTVIALSLMLLGGFYIENVPSFISWARYLSPFKFAFDASQQLVFDKPVPCDGSGVLEGICSVSDEGFATPDQIRKFLRVENSLGFNVAMLFVISIAPRYVAYLFLRAKKSGDRE